jgi:hypothetical protein
MADELVALDMPRKRRVGVLRTCSVHSFLNPLNRLTIIGLPHLQRYKEAAILE